MKRKAKTAADQKVIELRKELEGEEANAVVLAVDADELEKELQVLQRRAMLTGAATSTCGERVFHLMLESLPKQMEEKPEFMALLGTVRESMAELLNMANAVPKTVTHDIRFETGSSGQEMEDVNDDGYDDGAGSVELGSRSTNRWMNARSTVKKPLSDWEPSCKDNRKTATYSWETGCERLREEWVALFCPSVGSSETKMSTMETITPRRDPLAVPKLHESTAAAMSVVGSFSGPVCKPRRMRIAHSRNTTNLTCEQQGLKWSSRESSTIR